MLFPDLKKAETNLDAMKSQAQSTNQAHDTLLNEHRKLQVTRLPGGVGRVVLLDLLQWLSGGHCEKPVGV